MKKKKKEQVVHHIEKVMLHSIMEKIRNLSIVWYSLNIDIGYAINSSDLFSDSI